MRDLFPEQRAFVLDSSPTVAAKCGRRAGKSVGLACRLLRACERHPGELALYVAQTKHNARVIVGRALLELSRRYSLGLRMKEIDGRLHVLHPNGAMIWLAGAPNRAAWEDFRGPHYSEVDIDEAEIYTDYLQEVVEEIIEPAAADLEAPIAVTGTPNPVPVGYFHAVTTGQDLDAEGILIPQWSTHTWTMAENLFFKQGKGALVLEDLLKRRGWTRNHPTFQREYLGQWVDDGSALVLPFDPATNTYRESELAPSDKWIHVVSVDLGAAANERSTAFMVLKYRRGHPEVYIVETTKRAGLIPSAVAAHISALRDKYHPKAIIVDAGGLGVGYVREFNDLWNIPAEASPKSDRAGYIELVRGAMMSGQIKICLPEFLSGQKHPNADLLAELTVATWNEDHDDFDDHWPIHALDALLYGWRATGANYRPEENEPEFGSAEWMRVKTAEAKRKREAEIVKRVKARHQGWG